CVGRDHDRVRTHYIALQRECIRFGSAMDPRDARLGKDLSTFVYDCGRESVKVFERMKLRLVRKNKTRSGLKARKWSIIEMRHTAYACPAGSFNSLSNSSNGCPGEAKRYPSSLVKSHSICSRSTICSIAPIASQWLCWARAAPSRPNRRSSSE